MPRYITYLLLLLLLWPPRAKAQLSGDSIKNLLPTIKNDSVYVDLLNQLSKIYRYNEPTESIDFAVKAEKIAQNCNYQEGLAIAYHNLGALYADKERNELALEYYNKSLKIQRVFNNQQAMSHLYDNMGLIYRRLLKYDLALEYHNLSLGIKQKLGDTIGISYSYGNIGLIFSEQGKFDKALIHFYNSLRLKESLKDKYGMANSYGNIGVIYLKIKSYDQALANLERSLALFEEVKNNTGIAESLLYLSDIYARQNQLPKAIESLNRCLSIYQDKGNMKGMAESYLKLGKVYILKKQGHIAHDFYLKSLELYQNLNHQPGVVETKIALSDYYFNQSDYETAKLQLLSAIKLATPLGLKEFELEALKILIQIYHNEENYYKTSHLLFKAAELSDSLNAKRREKEIAQIQMQNEFDKKLLTREFENNRIAFEAEQRIKQFQLIRNLLIGGLIILMVLLIIIWRKSYKTTRQNKILDLQQQQITEQLVTLEAQKKALLMANETKNKFLTIIGHDLRYPFNAIISFVSLITDSNTRPNPQQLQKYLLLIKESGTNAQSLLENLLEWARNQSGELQAKKEKVSLNYIIRGNILLIKELAEQKQIRIIEDLEESNPQVVIDKNMINTVLRNLLSNAIKFNKPGGSVLIKTTSFENEIKITIRDTGIGIPPEQLSQLFEPNSNLQDRNSSGTTGLGLILCKEFLEKHQQELRVESTLNEGTAFWFYLPLSK
jgi:signal transduction histidine kinase